MFFFVFIISYVNNDKKKNYNNNESFENYKHTKGKAQSVDLGRIRNTASSFYNNNFNYEKEKMSLGLSSDQLMNNINNNSIMNDNTNIKDKKESDYENYVKNTRNDFYIIDKKVKEILRNEKLSPEKNIKFNNIYPISQRINMLNNVKKEIKVVKYLKFNIIFNFQ